MWLQKFFLYGCIGLLIEVLFTGIWSLCKRHWKTTGSTYLWMVLPYGGTALILEQVSKALPWPIWAKAFVYVAIIYGVEATYGATLMVLTGRLQKWFGGSGGGVVVWEYAKSAWSPWGLIQLKYFPAWWLLGVCFDPLSGLLGKVVTTLTGA